MPNASEYRAAARRLRRLSGQLTVDHRVLATATEPAQIAGGPVRWALERAAREVRVHVHRAAAELERLAVVCELRAEDRAVAGDPVELLRERGIARHRQVRP